MTRSTHSQPSHGQPGAPKAALRNRPRERHARGNPRTRNPRPQPPAEPGGRRADAGDQHAPLTPPGIIGGAVIHATRRSAELTRRTLARVLAVTPATVRGWENGTIPLAAVPYHQITQLAEALEQPGNQAGVLAELLIASQCDLLITRMLDGTEDYAEIPPIDEDTPGGAIARDLLRWALRAGTTERYSHLGPPGRALASADRARLMTAIHDLRAHSDPGLASYATALSELASPGDVEAR